MSYNNETVSSYANPVMKGVNLSIGVIILCLNSFSWAIIAKGKLIAKQHKICFSGFLITDSLVGLLVTSIRLIPFEYGSDHIICRSRLYIGCLLVFASCQSNIMITTERFIRIYRPLIAKTILTCNRLLVGLVIIWLLSAALTFGIFHKGLSGTFRYPACQVWTCGDPKQYIPTGLVIIVSFLTIMSMYIYIIMRTKRHFRQIAMTFVGEHVNTNIWHLTNSERRSNATVGIIVTAFGISYLPLGVYSLYYGITVDKNDPFSPFNANNQIFTFLLCLMMLNSIMNPIIYIWRLKTSRQEALEWLGSWFRLSERMSSSSASRRVNSSGTIWTVRV